MAAATLAVLFAVSLCASALPLQSAAGQKPEARINVSDSVTAPSEPKILKKVNPAYPPDAKAEKVEGVYVIEVVIGKDGAIHDAKVVASMPGSVKAEGLEAKRGSITGDPRLAQAALDAVRQWTYEPILKGGKPVEAKATVTVVFKLA